MHKGTTIYVGSYTRAGNPGISVWDFDAAEGKLNLRTEAEAENASFLAFAPDRRFLYAVNELGQPGGGVSAFRVDAETGGLTFLNRQPSHGTYPCHLSVDQTGRCVYVANYGSGVLAAYRIQADGSLSEATEVVQHTGAGPDKRRQEGPHAHSITVDPSNRFALAADLGIDKVMLYRLDLEGGKLIPHAPPWAEVAGGSGPRHLDFDPTGRFVYLINEMGNTITVFSYDADAGTLSTLQTVPTLPEDFTGRNTCADIHVHPSGRFLYGSNRGHNSLVCYTIDGDTGLLNYGGHQSTLGETPRNFAIDPSGRFLLAANQDSDSIVVFAIDAESGQLTPTGEVAQVPAPVCIRFP